MNVEELLSERISLPQIKSVASWASGNADNLSRLWDSVRSGNRRRSMNALWTITHLPVYDSEWIVSLRDRMIDMLLTEKDTGKKRVLLKILREQEYDADNIRTDFLDFCMSKINSECEPYAVRCYCMYAAFNMCRHYRELLSELDEHLDMMSSQPLSPGMKSALRQTKTKIRRILGK